MMELSPDRKSCFLLCTVLSGSFELCLMERKKGVFFWHVFRRATVLGRYQVYSFLSFPFKLRDTREHAFIHQQHEMLQHLLSDARFFFLNELIQNWH